MSTLFREHLRRVVGRDLRACFADFCGYRLLSPDQERHIELLETQPRVIAMGASGTGKTFVQGVAAAILVATSFGAKAIFGAPKLEQAIRLSWLELQQAVLRSRLHSQLYSYVLADRRVVIAREDEVAPISKLVVFRSQSPVSLSSEDIGVSEWYPGGKSRNPGWFAACMAMSDRNQAASVKGMLHGGRVLAVFDELEGVAPEVLDVIVSSTSQENSHFWLSFNPVSRETIAGRLWLSSPESCRVHYSALRCAEWQQKTGVKIPGMPTFEAIRQKWAGRENEPLYSVYVLGEFPPENVDWVVVPQDWSRKVVNCIPEPAERDKSLVTVGVDTGWGGSAETVICVMVGRCVLPLRAYRGLRDVPHTAGLVQAAIEETAREYGIANRDNFTVAVDVIGTGGAGVYDLLKERGVRVLAIQGGSSSVGSVKVPETMSNCITWGWWEIRERIRRTIECMGSGDIDGFEISLPDGDRKLQEQLSRTYRIRGDRKIELESKEKILAGGGQSPDRADALAMAVLAQVARPPKPFWGVV